MAKPGTLALNLNAIREVKDLYNWGMQVWMICAFYGIHKRTLSVYLKHMAESGWIVRRPNGRAKDVVKSTLPRSRVAVAQQPDPFEDAYQLVREHARVLLRKRTEPHREDVSIRSYREAVSELRSVCERNGTRPLGPELSLGTGHGRKGSPHYRRTVSAAMLPPRAGACRDR